MGRLVKPRSVTLRAGQLIPQLDDPVQDPEVFKLLNNGREVTALPTVVPPATVEAT